MASYVVMEPPRGGADDAAIVRDGFRFWAFILPVVWLLFNRLWLEAAVVFVLAVAVGALGTFLGGNALASIASLALGILVGLEAASLKLAAMRRRGWREWGVVEADNAAGAEIRYLAEAVTVSDAAPTMPDSGRTDGIVRARPVSGPALGMLAYPVKG